MKGFFLLEDELDYCQACGLFRTCESPKMDYSGKGEKKALIIAEAPGEEEDKRGVQLVGKAGGLLREQLNDLGFDLDRDFWKINSVNCRPPKNRKPTKHELKYCKSRVDRVIKKLKPKFIFLMGGVAVESFYLDHFSDSSITRWRKRCIPDFDHNCWVIPLYHPSYVNRNKDQKLEMVFEQDLIWATSCLQRSRPEKVDYESQCEILGETEALYFLGKEILSQSSKTIAFDYETNGLNPWKHPDPEVVCISVCDGTTSKSFLNTEAVSDFWKRVLQREDIRKIAHNLKFEEKWSRVVFGTPVKGWLWDTMTTEHVLDNRKRVTGLKFQAYVRYGEKGYDKKVEPYIKLMVAGKFDTLSPTAVKEILKYNALDSLFTFKLYEDQKKELRRKRLLQKGNELFFEGVVSLADVEANGVYTDPVYYRDKYEQLEVDIKNLTETLLKSEEAQLFKKHTKRVIDLGSPTDLKKLLYDILKLPVFKYTENENEAVDQEVLEHLDIPFGKNLIVLRKKSKVKDTYLSQFIREVCSDRRLHPNFDLHLVTSYRSSSSNPNFQNIPVRDLESKQTTRAGIIPSPGNKILEADYGSLEVRIMACYTEDPVLIDYLVTGGDMHLDEAKSLFLFTDEEWADLDKKLAKELRFYTKNQKVFPYFYGSYYKSCCANLWPIIEMLQIKPHLRRKGIKRESDFEEWMREDEERFWKKFNVFREWQRSQEEEYLTKGKVDFYTGFSIDGYLTKNQLLNMKVQGTAFHCLLWSLIKLNQELKDYKSKIIGQIHDSIVTDLVPEEQDEIVPLYNHVMTEMIRLEWPWIIVPMVAEFEITEVDQPWSTKKELK